MNLDKVHAELRRPPHKRTMGGDRDPMGFFILCAALPDGDETLWATALPRQVHCGTCRFASNELEKGPCYPCFSEGGWKQMPYPKWKPNESN